MPLTAIVRYRGGRQVSENAVERGGRIEAATGSSGVHSDRVAASQGDPIGPVTRGPVPLFAISQLSRHSSVLTSVQCSFHEK